MPKQEKVDSVVQIREIFKEAQAVIFTDYRGLTVNEVSALRSKLFQGQAQYKVHKNTLTKIAAKETEMDPAVDSILMGPVAMASTKTDPAALAKILVEFSKQNEKLVIKGGLLDGKMIDLATVKDLAALPSREVLLAKLLGTLNAPINGFVNVLAAVPRGLVTALDAIRAKKEAGA